MYKIRICINQSGTLGPTGPTPSNTNSIAYPPLAATGFAFHHVMILIIRIVIDTTMFMVRSLCHSHCESSSGSSDECSTVRQSIFGSAQSGQKTGATE